MFFNSHLGSILPMCLLTAFKGKDPKSALRQSRHQCLFALLGFALAKADQKILVKLTTGLNFINVLRTPFTHVDPKSVRIQSNPQYLFTHLGFTCAKADQKMLVKSTPGRVNFAEFFGHNSF